ncbi:putative bifunctional diguanylate cyclase/phosphodiesterase [Aureimonas jatrophae]|uniref:Diguanylate cyclase (GGDEF) domain-containing protein n=1 Tax=Aureimonas jatrophae TaxID=1166073 RepID=A0A1H0GD47_9HYPH|nr:bifunctional diguanylate cyclase/phosphodiesterase [Aureimonas jatrophae]MBB3949515.1 diguanylate cyclase (GGDEF)-like protein [Aureimonas jatrophae]SDO04774.1 diguanylate cyclase (GGDEF) domain-containing protein [Aureimonas jatrophae]
MKLKAIRSYMMTTMGGAIVLATVACASVFLAERSVDKLMEADAERAATRFASYLTGNQTALDALLTGVSREADIETAVRDISAASGIANFTIFDDRGTEVFSPRSIRYEWLLRNRPGGTVTGDRLADDYVRRDGSWVALEKRATGDYVVILPLQRDGQRIGFLGVMPDSGRAYGSYVRVLGIAAAVLVGILLTATGIPALIYIQRKRRIEQADERIQFLANHDALTGLLNRKRVQEEADRILATARATRERLTVFFVDLQNLGDINNSLGQPTGDELLRTLANRLRTMPDVGDLAARIGPDDFVLLQRRTTTLAEIDGLAVRLKHALEQDVVIDGHTLQPRICIGAASTPDHGRTFDEVVRHAELALTVHKSHKLGNYVLFDPGMDEEAHRRRTVERMVRTALAEDGFELFYQPIVSARQGTALGFEALIRLPDGAGGYIPPSVFIPIAEARGLIKEIGNWVLREATRQIALWPEPLFVSVNLSAVQFAEDDLLPIIEDALANAGIAGHRLEIEVVESLLLDRRDTVLRQLQDIKALGISIAMDDFGTGYSSLGYLWRFPFDKLKIDQSFMAAFNDGEPNIERILETIIAMGHHMGMKVTTEGVETREQSDVLSRLGCDQLQGYYFGKPMPADRVADTMLRNFAANAQSGMEPQSAVAVAI